MADLSTYLQTQPALAGWYGTDQLRRQQNTGNLADQLGKMKMIQGLQENQNRQKLSDIMRQTGGDPTKSIQALLQFGTPESVGLAAKLHDLLPPAQKPEPTPDFVKLLKIRDVYAANGDTKNAALIDAQIKKMNEGLPRPDANPAPTMTEVVDPKDPSRMLRVDARAYKGGSLGDIGVLGISGKEPSAAAKEKEAATGQASVDNIIADLRDKYRQLDTSGGITNPEKGVVSNIEAGIGSSGVGQFAGRLFGTQNQSLRNQIAQTRPLLLSAIKQRTGMSAKQMDSNVELKLWLSVATDPTLDIKANMNALDNIEKMIGSGKLSSNPSNPQRLKFDSQGNPIP